MSFDPGDFYPEGSGGTPPGPGPEPATDFIRREEFTEALAGKVATDDPRLSDARTPTAHAHGQSDVTGLPAALAAKLSRQEAEDGFTEWTVGGTYMNGTPILGLSVVWMDGAWTVLHNGNTTEPALSVSMRDATGMTWDAESGDILPEGWGCVEISRTRLPTLADLDAKQDTIADLDAIRSGAALGATAVQPAALRYELVTMGAAGVNLIDRAINAFTADGDTASPYVFYMPDAASGHARDLMLSLTVEDSGSHAFSFVIKRGLPVPGIYNIVILFGSSELSRISQGRNLILFTEVAANRWLVSVRHEDFTAAELAALEGGNE